MMQDNVNKMIEGLHGLQSTLRQAVSKNSEAYNSLTDEQKEMVDFAAKDLSFKGNDLDSVLDKCKSFTNKFKH